MIGSTSVGLVMASISIEMSVEIALSFSTLTATSTLTGIGDEFTKSTSRKKFSISKGVNSRASVNYNKQLNTNKYCKS